MFDVGGVLIRWDDRWAMDEAARRLDVPASELRGLLLRLRPSLQSGRIDLDGMWDRIAGSIGRPVPTSVRSLWWSLLEQEGRPRREVLRWAAELRRQGLRTALFSNTDASHRQYFRRPWSQGFAPHLLSYQLGAAKPSPRAFRAARTRLGVPASHLCLVDDVSQNVRAAQRAGWRAHTFRGVRDAERFLRRLGWLE